MTYIVKEITQNEALEMVKKYHYSNSLPKINKHFVGFYIDSKLVGVVTLGWGTRPLHTIKRMFPSLTTKDYYEIGRMCMREEMPRNSESQMLSDLCKWLKQKEPNLKLLFTWADGMLGKVGYVYQASGFIYAGYSEGEIYLKDGIKIHPRQMSAFFKESKDDKRITIRPTKDQMKKFGIEHIRGKQFRYVRFLCGKTEKKKLIKECLISLDEPKPKEKDLVWRVYDFKTNKWIITSRPNYKTDISNNCEEKNILAKEIKDTNQLSIFDFI